MDVVIGELVPDKSNMMNAYILHTRCTHSNGSTTPHRCRFNGDDLTSIINYWRFFDVFLGVTFDDAKDLTIRAKRMAASLEMDDGVTVFKEVIPHDVCLLGSMAMLTHMELRYWDDQGHEHYVDITPKSDVSS